MWRTWWAPALVTAGVLLVAGCGRTGSESPGSSTPSPTATVSNGAFVVLGADGRPVQRYPIGSDGVVAAPDELAWESEGEGQATRLVDAVGPWALTATYQPPLTDGSLNTQLQVRDAGTGEVLHRLDVPGWCSGPDGADYPCVLLDDARFARSTPLGGVEEGVVTVSATDTGQELGQFGPFPALAAVRATSSPDALVLISFDGASMQHTAQTLDLRTGNTAPIGSLPITQPWLCVLGTDSVLTVDGTTLQALGPADVAAVEVPELAGDGPGAVGCTPDGGYLYLRTDWTVDPGAGLVLDAIALADGARTAGALTLGSQQASVVMTR